MSAEKARLLVVDDDPDLRTTLPLILAGCGYRVRSASDGFAALAEIHSEMPDILISDLYMPGMSGFELLKQVRRNFPSIGVVAMSSAFSGTSVPSEVDADVFYEKATGVPALLALVKSLDSPHASELRQMLADALPTSSSGAIASS